MKQAANLHMTVPMALPGIKVSTSPTDFHPIKQMQLPSSTARPGCCSER